mgnify:CR=1 FL=1
MSYAAPSLAGPGSSAHPPPSGRRPFAPPLLEPARRGGRGEEAKASQAARGHERSLEDGMSSGDIDRRDLETRLGHEFSDPALIERALTHASHFAVGVGPTYERLEFLGDRVLGLSIATMLYEAYPDAPEGELAQRYNQLVKRETCAAVAIDLGIDRSLRLGAAEAEAGGRRRTAILADACEAVLAAVYLDGGFAAARGLVEREWGGRMREARRPERDSKTVLQERLQGDGHPPPVYTEVDRTGPDHAPVFTIEVSGDGFRAERGTGTSKRAAEQNAARAVLVQLGALSPEVGEAS